MAATIPDRRKRRRAGAPWTLGLLALLFVFWRYIGGPGGWIPGSGAGTETRDAANSRPARSDGASQGSTARRVVTAQFVAPPTPPPAAGRLAGGQSQIRARAVVARPSKAASPGSHVSIELTRDGKRFEGAGRIEVTRVRDGERGAPARYPIAGGKATIPGAPAGERFRIRILPEGEPEAAGEFVVEEGEHSVDLFGRATIRGRASFEGGVPAASQDFAAKLFRIGREGEEIAFKSQADGSFAIEASCGQDVLLEIRPRGSIAGADAAALVFDRPLLEAGATWDLGPDPIVFEREVVLAEGVVSDAQGNPAAGATVFALPIRLPVRALVARADASGRFSVKGPPGADACELFATTENDGARLDALVTKGSTALALTLAPAGSIRGRIASPAHGLNPLLRVELQTERRNVFTTTSVGPGGGFDFPHVPAGRWSVVVTGPRIEARELAGIDVPPGGPSPDGRLQEVALGPGLAAATLLVIDDSGAPVPDAAVEVLLGHAASLCARTDASGAVAVVVPAVPVPVTVLAKGFDAVHETWDGRRTITLHQLRAESSASR